MPVTVNKIDTFQTRFFQSFVNLTKYDSTKYPALTTVKIDQPEYCTTCEAVTAYSIYDQWALRVLGHQEPLHSGIS
jgi:hypothetical protein